MDGGPTDSLVDRRAVTPIVGNILLVAVAIVIGVVLVTLSFAFLDGLQPKSPDVVTEAEVTDGEIRLYHRAGTNLDPANLEVVAKSPGETTRIPFSQGKLTGGGSTFSAGDRWRYCQVSDPGTRVETMLVHTPTNSVLARTEQSARETAKDGLEYRCGSAARLIGRNGGYVTFNMTNFADETVEITAVTITSDTEATRLEGLNSSGIDHTDLYIDATGGTFTFDPNNPGPDGIAYSRPSAGPFDVGDSPEPIDLTSGPGWAFDTAVIQPGDTARFSLYQFQDPAGNPVDMRSAELTVTLEFVDRGNRTYSIILPQQRSEG